MLPVSFFERSGPAYFNSLIVFDADGSSLGVYRKSHLPAGPAMKKNTTSRPATRDSGSSTPGTA